MRSTFNDPTRIVDQAAVTSVDINTGMFLDRFLNPKLETLNPKPKTPELTPACSTTGASPCRRSWQVRELM